jgi:NitT/TauT family transport system permease protein
VRLKLREKRSRAAALLDWSRRGPYIPGCPTGEGRTSIAAMIKAKRLLPFSGLVLVVGWAVAAVRSEAHLIPSPWAVVKALAELISRGLLIKHLVASLFRVTWGYLSAIVLAVPAGIALGWYGRAERALSPILQVLRPISPLAWIPLAILWFGVGDMPAIFIIFLGSFFPMALTTMSAVKGLSLVHINVASNFGLRPADVLRKLIVPAIMPQLIVGMRLSLGVAWLVVVAGEMIAVNSGLGFLIIDARNAGNRYDLVVTGMVLIGTTGLVLDHLVRRLERLRGMRWSYSVRAEGGG